MNNEQKKTLIEWLDERYSIAVNSTEAYRTANINFYNGAISAVEFFGYFWTRDVNGHHTLGKR